MNSNAMVFVRFETIAEMQNGGCGEFQDLVAFSLLFGKNTQNCECIQNGCNADPLVDQLKQVDYHDLLYQMGGPEGF